MEYPQDILGIFKNKESLSKTPRRQEWVLVACLDPTIKLKAFIVVEQYAITFFTIHDDQLPKVEPNEYL